MGTATDIYNKYGLIPYIPGEETLNKYTSIDAAIKILENQSLRFSQASAFNDPFELTIDNIDFTPTDNQVKDLIERRHNGSSAEKEALFQQHKKDPSLLQKVIKKGLIQLKDEFGICCFSRNHDNKLMWSHYANNHYGVCLGFENLINGGDIFVFHVQYVENLQPDNYWSMHDRLFPLWPCTKSKDWAYEEEVRAINVKNHGFINFPIESLTKIFYGLRTTAEDIRHIENIIQVNGYKVERYKMEQRSPTFSLTSKSIQ